MDAICTAIKTKNSNIEHLTSMDGWNNLNLILNAGSSVQWNCRHCTFTNTDNSDSCDMCGLPKE
jgi:rubrerythrin